MDRFSHVKFLQALTPLWATLPLVAASACSNVSDLTGPVTILGSIQVTVVTVGEMLDPDGYLMLIDEDLSQPVGVNATIQFNAVPAGFYEGQLTEVAENCEVTAPNPRPITVVRNAESEILFNVTCTVP